MMPSKKANRQAAAAFGVLWEAKAEGRTMRGFTVASTARERIRKRNHDVGSVTARGLELMHRDGDLVIVRGSSTALLDAEVTITDQAFARSRALEQRGHEPRSKVSDG